MGTYFSPQCPGIERGRGRLYKGCKVAAQPSQQAHPLAQGPREPSTSWRQRPGGVISGPNSEFPRLHWEILTVHGFLLQKGC